MAKNHKKYRLPSESLQAPVRLKITGFSSQSIVSLEEIVKAIDIIPSYHLSGLNEISYKPDLYAYGMPYAAYINEFRSIVFYKICTKELFTHVLYHEIGHYVYYLIVHSQVKKMWVTEIYPNSTCITPYGAHSPSEDFAETYSYYIRTPELLKLITEKYIYMKNVVFSGLPESLKEKFKT